MIKINAKERLKTFILILFIMTHKVSENNYSHPNILFTLELLMI